MKNEDLRKVIIEAAKKEYPMSCSLHSFLVDLCNAQGWSSKQLFREIFNEG